MHQRICAAYHIEHTIATRLGLPQYPCIYTWCKGACIKKVEVVARHHLKYGRNRYLMYPVIISSSTHKVILFEGILSFVPWKLENMHT